MNIHLILYKSDEDPDDSIVCGYFDLESAEHHVNSGEDLNGELIIYQTLFDGDRDIKFGHAVYRDNTGEDETEIEGVFIGKSDAQNQQKKLQDAGYENVGVDLIRIY